jgi:hypothetical protein
MHQILGEDLKTPCNLVVCYTAGGKGGGGTGQALRAAKDHNVPILDLGNYMNKKDMIDNFNLFMKNLNK